MIVHRASGLRVVFERVRKVRRQLDDVRWIAFHNSSVSQADYQQVDG
jgi:hypothetical protein